MAEYFLKLFDYTIKVFSVSVFTEKVQHCVHIGFDGNGEFIGIKQQIHQWFQKKYFQEIRNM